MPITLVAILLGILAIAFGALTATVVLIIARVMYGVDLSLVSRILR